MLKYLITLGGLFVLVVGIMEARESQQNPEPIKMTVAEYMQSDKSLPYITFTDAEVNLLYAVVVHKEKTDKIKLLYVPINAPGFEQKDTLTLLLETDDEAVLETAATMMGLSAGEQIKYFAENRDKLILKGPLTGKMTGKHGMDGDHRKKMHSLMDNLADDFQIMDHNRLPNVGAGITLAVIGLLILLFGVWRIKKAKGKAPPIQPEPQQEASETVQK